MSHTVGELSRLTGVTVRALHHYDELGLVRPSARSAAGYRLYADADVVRLRQVLFWRELGVALDEIAALLTLDEADAAALLRRHRDEVVARRDRLDHTLAAIDAAITRCERGATMSTDTVKTLFDGFQPEEHEAEARERWGQTEAFQESQRRTARYDEADWAQLRAEADEIYRRAATLMTAGRAPDDAEVQAAVEDHRRHIDRWFYPCSAEIHRGLGELYVADPRFTANLDRYGDGLARFLRDAIVGR